MGMKRRTFLIGSALCGSALYGCAPSSVETTAKAAYSEIDSTQPGSASAPTVAVFMPRTAQASEVWTGLRDELASDFKLIAVEVEGRESAPAIAEGLRRHRPDGIVLMNNPTLAAYRDVQRHTQNKDFPPAVVVMTSFLVKRPPGLIATTGISYEVPLITVVTNLRRLMAKPITRVGIVARSSLVGFVRHQVELAAREHISVHVEEVSARPNAAEIKRAIRRAKRGVDALWILNDNQTLSPDLIADAWLPGMNERPWVPAIVGAAPLVSPKIGFGTFGVLPDHTALGAQTANMLLDLADNDWVLPEGTDVELPLSTLATIDLPQADQRFALRSDALQMVDRVLK